MKKQILKHIQVVNEMEKAHIPYGFVSKFGAESCWQISRRILELGISWIVEKMSAAEKEYLMGDMALLRYLKQLEPVLGDMSIWVRLKNLIYQAGEEKLTVLDCKDIQEVLLDQEISGAIQYNFLKYFKKLELTQENRARLFEGLSKYQRKVDIELGLLLEEERAIVMHPIFVTNLMDNLWNVRAVWTHLTNPEVLALIQVMNASVGIYEEIMESQFSQLVEKPAEIRLLLEAALQFFTEEQRPDFLHCWLENDVLLPDLKRFVKLLPDMESEQKEKILHNKMAYLCCIYKVKMNHLDMELLSYLHRRILFYAIVTGKKHFLRLVDENSEDFLAVRQDSLLLDSDIYRNHLNLNALNEKNLKDSYNLRIEYKKGKEFLKRGEYTFEELKTLAPLYVSYYQLYELLANDRSDERLRVLKELAKRDCLPYYSEEDGYKLEALAKKLSEKSLSAWMQEELGHIKDLTAAVSVELLTNWDNYRRFIPELDNVRQAMYLIRNQDKLAGYHNLTQFQENMLREDTVWPWLKEALSITDDFEQKYENRIRQFVYDGEAEILYKFCQNSEDKWETVRRLLTAELMGAFKELKYHEEDLEREIAYPVSAEVENAWKDNLERSVKDGKMWEEDRFIPVLQVGENPMRTCISYIDGANKDCLLSCFDSNKKVLFFEKNGRIVFRALLRLTKGSVTEKPIPVKKIEFVDLTKENSSVDQAVEELVLFLERPYFAGISEYQENTVVSWIYQMVKEKAKKLHARVVISPSYRKYEVSNRYELMHYYVYISASKNGKQYLDSLGGEATVIDSGNYGKNYFLMERETEQKNLVA